MFVFMFYCVFHVKHLKEGFMDSDFLVIGSGIAGLSFALRAAELGSVLLVTKKKEADTATNLAQGGIAAVLSGDDSEEMHERDTVLSGAGLCDPCIVKMVVKEGPGRVNDLVDIGVDFIRDSGFFKDRQTHGIYGLLNDENKCNILESGVCGIGDFKIGKNPGEDLDLYGIIRLDVLVPSVARFPLYKMPMINVGKAVVNDEVVLEELKCELPVIQKGRNFDGSKLQVFTMTFVFYFLIFFFVIFVFIVF